jgi:hypothetical protein
MKVDLNKTINGYDGKPLLSKVEGVQASLPDGKIVYFRYGLKVKDSSGNEIELIDNRKPRTIGDVLLECVTTPLQDDKDHTPERRIRLFELAQLIHKNKDKSVTLTAEDIVELKSRSHTLYLDAQIFAGIVNAIDPAK